MSLLDKLSLIPNLIPTPDGAYTLQYQNKLIHSSRSPLKEVDKLLSNLPKTNKKSTLILAWGTGLGYHIEKLIEEGYHVLAIEFRTPVAEIFQKVFPVESLVGFIDHTSGLFDMLVTLEGKGYDTFIDLSMLGLSIPTDLYEEAQQGKRVLCSFHNIYFALMESWYYNIVQNLPLLSLPHIGYTKSPIFEHQNLVICSAGPSLKESLPSLKKNRDRITLLAVDTALLTLIQAGLIPDYVHSVDAKIHNIADFRGIPNTIFQKMTLIADITLSHQVTTLPWQKVLFTSTAHPINTIEGLQFKRPKILQYLWDNGIHFPELQTGGSVATSAFSVGVLYKASQIILVGQDLAYSQNRGHSVGSPYDLEYRLQCSRLKPLDTIHIHKIPFDESPVPAIHGGMTYGDSLLYQFRSWFETSLKDNASLKNKVVNASEEGALFQYWEHKPLSQMVFSRTPIQNHRVLLHYSKEEIQSILQDLLNIPIIYPNTHPLAQEFFYKEHQKDDTDLQRLEKKERLLYQKIRSVL